MVLPIGKAINTAVGDPSLPVCGPVTGLIVVPAFEPTGAGIDASLNDRYSIGSFPDLFTQCLIFYESWEGQACTFVRFQRPYQVAAHHSPGKWALMTGQKQLPRSPYGRYSV
jgi:hypothetical protein